MLLNEVPGVIVDPKEREWVLQLKKKRKDLRSLP